MHRNIVIIVLVFLSGVGVGVGGLAFGQKDQPPSKIEPVMDEPLPRSAMPIHGVEPESGINPEPTSIADTGTPDPDDVQGHPVATDGLPADQVLIIESRWSDLSNRVDRLSRRVVELELQLGEQAAKANADDEPPGPDLLPINTPEDRRSALVFAGVDRRTAQEIVSRESELAMERLDLRDRAAREGWVGTQRFVEELDALNDRAIDLRSEVGDAAFDRFLYETGQPNRVAVSSVLAGSQGDLAGFLPGDIIEGYAGEAVFDFNDLRSATTAGTRDETVAVTIRRNDQLIETWVARGPIGVTLQADSADPNW